jgi:hypothetical protein
MMLFCVHNSFLYKYEYPIQALIRTLISHCPGLYSRSTDPDARIDGIRIFFLVFRIRIHRIHVFFGLPDPDPLVRGMDPDEALDPDPSIIMQK